MEEVWKDIKGYEGIYQLSNLGRIKNIKRNIIRRPSGHNGGYQIILLCKEGVMRGFSIHRLVAEAFIPNPENKPEVNHIDEDKTNNSASNLEWVTSKENNNYGTRVQRSSKGIIITNTSGKTLEFPSMTACADYLGCTVSSISYCVRNKKQNREGYTFKYK